MEIIRTGTKDQVSCGHCGSVLRYGAADVRLRHAPVAAGPWEVECMPEPEDDYRAEVTCPVCKHAVAVKLPREQKRNLMAAARSLDDPTY